MCRGYGWLQSPTCTTRPRKRVRNCQRLHNRTTNYYQAASRANAAPCLALGRPTSLSIFFPSFFYFYFRKPFFLLFCSFENPQVDSESTSRHARSQPAQAASYPGREGAVRGQAVIRPRARVGMWMDGWMDACEDGMGEEGRIHEWMGWVGARFMIHGRGMEWGTHARTHTHTHTHLRSRTPLHSLPRIFVPGIIRNFLGHVGLFSEG